jgi:hypothetical protein
MGQCCAAKPMSRFSMRRVMHNRRCSGTVLYVVLHTTAFGASASS